METEWKLTVPNYALFSVFHYTCLLSFGLANDLKCYEMFFVFFSFVISFNWCVLTLQTETKYLKIFLTIFACVIGTKYVT